MVWENVKDIYHAHTTTYLGKCSAVLLLVAFGVSLRYADKHSDSRRHFACNTNQPNKSFIEAECFDKYGQDYVDSFPPVAFVGFYVSLIVLLTLYTLFAIRHVLAVEKHKEDLTQIPRKRSMEHSYSMFVSYVMQIGLRIVILALLIWLQLTQRPKSFPSTYQCNLKTPFNCKDHFYKENTTLNYVTLCLSAAIILSSALDCGYVLKKCCWKRREVRRLNNLRFTCFLLDIQEEDKQTQELTTVEDYDHTGLQQKIKEKILAKTETHEKIFERKITTDKIFTRLVIRSGRIEHSLRFGSRSDNLPSYTTGGPENTVIERAHHLFTPSDDTQNPKLILLTGRAGIGKTMFSTKLVRDWASGELFCCEGTEDRFQFVFLFFFRQLNEYGDKTLSLHEFLNMSHELDKDEFEYVRQHPQNTLIVMDGFDEFKSGVHKNDLKKEPEQTKYSIAAICAQLLNRSLLFGATVVTSRPDKSLTQLPKEIKFDREAEILGFEANYVEHYFFKFFEGEDEKAKIAHDHVKANANLLGFCYVPVNCFITCLYFDWRFKTCGSLQEKELPATTTELYKEILDMFTVRHNPNCREQKRDTKTPQFSKGVPKTFDELSRLAFILLQAKKYVFDESDLQKGMDSDLINNVLKSGIIHSIPGCRTGPFTAETKYCFIHLTIQEFLAARYLVEINREESMILILIENHLNVVIQFVSGLLKNLSSSEDPTKLLTFIVDNLYKRNFPRSRLLAIKCLFEYGDSSFAKRILQKYDFIETHLPCIKVDDADCAALAFILSMDVNDSRAIRVLNLRDNIITHIGVKYLMEAVKNPKCCLKQLRLEMNSIGNEGAKYVSDALKSGLPSLKQLDLSSNGIGDEGAKYVSDALKSGHCSLKQLDLSDNIIGSKGAKYVSDALKSVHCSLEQLNLLGNIIGKKGAKYVSDALKSGHCSLQQFNLFGSIIGVKGDKYVSNARKSDCCSLDEQLDPSRTSIGVEGAKYVSDVLKSGLCGLEQLKLSRNCIGDEGAKYVSDALKSGLRSLEQLDLSYNDIGDKGAKYVSDALKSGHCSLKRLHLSRNGIDDESAKYLNDALKSGHFSLITENGESCV